MQRYILRRLGFLLFVIIGVTVLLFVIMYLLPGDPARAAAGPGAKPEQVERIRIKLGLDKPPHIQYLTYMGNLLRGDLGTSIRTRKPVLVELKTYLPASLELALTAMLLNVLVAIPLGVFSALRPGHLADTLSRLFAALGMGMPVFWVALMAQLLVAGKLDLLPFGGRLSTGALPPDHVTGFFDRSSGYTPSRTPYWFRSQWSVCRSAGCWAAVCWWRACSRGAALAFWPFTRSISAIFRS